MSPQKPNTNDSRRDHIEKKDGDISVTHDAAVAYTPFGVSLNVVKKTNHSPIHCKHCNGCVIKELDTNAMDGMASFAIRCPHCAKDIFVSVKVSKHPIVDME